MPEILSIAVFEPQPGKEELALSTMRGLGALMAAKNYSRDCLYRDAATRHYFLFRYWTSADSRREAQEDPQVHAFWVRLGELIQTRVVYEQLEEIGAPANPHGP